MAVRKATVAILSVLALLLVTPAAWGGTAATTLRVGAAVLPYVSLDARQQMTTYYVADEDVARGYIDLSGAVTVSFRTNLERGVPVGVENLGEGRVLVSEAGKGNFVSSAFTLDPAGYRIGARVERKLDARIVLSPDTPRGVHQLALGITPII
ncbi:hypothetical protein GMSM_16330 [Geomonas sp. Red276]